MNKITTRLFSLLLLFTLHSVKAKVEITPGGDHRITSKTPLDPFDDGRHFYIRTSAPSGQPTTQVIDAAVADAEANGRIIKVTSGGLAIPTALKEITSLPAIFRTTINGVGYDIVVISMTFQPNAASLSLGCRFTVPGSASKLYFGSNNIAVSGKSGFIGDLPILDTSLSDTKAAELDDAANLLGGQTRFAEFSLPGFKDNLAMGLGKETKLSLSCGAFNKLSLSGFVKSYNLVEKESKTGEPLITNKPLLLVFNGENVSDWTDLYLNAKVSSAFHSKNYPDLGFHFSDNQTAIIDLSNIRNPSNLPSCAQVSAEAWQGIAFPSFKVRLPKFFKLRSGISLAMGNGKNLFMDANGLLGNVGGENIYTLQEGYSDDINKYDMSLENLTAFFECNGNVTASMLGKIALPWCGTSTGNAPLLRYSFRYTNNRYEIFVKDSDQGNFTSRTYALPTGSKITFGVQNSQLYVTALLAEKPALAANVYNQSICKDFPATITASQCSGKTLIWNTGQSGASITVKPMVTTAYTVKCQDNYCVSATSDSMRITVYESLPTPTLISGRDAFCRYEATDLSAGHCVGKMEWKTPGNNSFSQIGDDGRTQNASFPSINQSTGFTYAARCNLNSCLSPETTKTVMVNPEPTAPTLSSNAANNTIDRNNQVALSGNCSNGARLIWQDLSPTAVAQTTVTLSNTATYHAICRNDVTGCQSQSNGSITINVLYFPPGAPSNLAFSNAGTNFLTLTWQDNSNNEDGFRILRSTSPSFANHQVVGTVGSNTTSLIDRNLTEGITYYYQVISFNRYDNGYSEWVSRTTDITQKAPNPRLRADKNPVKPGENTVVYSDGCDGTVTWSNGATGNSIWTGAGEYWAVCKKDGYRDSEAGTIRIDQDNTPNELPQALRPNIRADRNPIKPGENTVVYAEGCDGTVTWSNGATGSSIWTGAGEYWAVCKKDGYRESEAATIRIDQDNTPNELPQAPRPNMRADRNPVKPGENTVVYADGCDGTVTWSNGATGNSIWTGAGDYWAICKKDGYRDSEAGTIRIDLDNTPSELPQAPRPNMRADRNPIKPGENTVVYAEGCDGTVTWSNGATGNSIWTGAGEYWAVCKKDGYRDSEAATIRIDQDNTPTELPQAARPNMRADRNPVKPGENTVVYADGCDGTVTWSNGATGSSIWTGAGEYWAVCKKDGYRESEAATIRIDQDNTPNELPQAPRPNMRADRNPVKPGENTVVYADGCDGTVTWSNGATGNSIWTGAGEYWAVCKKDGYWDSEAGMIRIDQDNTLNELPQAPRPNMRADRNPIKPGENTVVYAEGCDGTVTWSNGATGNSIWTGAGEYWAVCKKDGYRDSEAATIRIDQDNTPNELPQAPKPIMSAEKNPVKTGENTVVYANGCDGTVSWSTSENGNSIWTGAGEYWAVCKKDGYRDSDAATIRIDLDNTPSELPQAPKPIMSAERNPIKAGENTVVYASGCDGTVTWSTNVNGGSIWTGPGDYWAVCKKDGYRDSEKGTIRIDLDNTPSELPQAPKPIMSADKNPVKPDEKTVVYAKECDGTVTWSTNENGNSIWAGSGEYWAVCKKNGYRDSEKGTIRIDQDNTTCDLPATPWISVDDLVLPTHGSGTLSAQGCETGTVSWSTGVTARSISVDQTGYYTATCTVSNDCGSTSSSDGATVNTPTPTVCPLPAPRFSVNWNSVFTEEITIKQGDGVQVSASCQEGALSWNSGNPGWYIPSENMFFVTTCVSGQCSKSTWLRVKVQKCTTPPTPNISGPDLVNSGTTFRLDASGCPANSTFSWSASATNNPTARIMPVDGFASDSWINASISSETQFSVSCTNDGCTSGTGYKTVKVQTSTPTDTSPHWQPTNQPCGVNGKKWIDVNPDSQTHNQTKCVETANPCKTYTVTVYPYGEMEDYNNDPNTCRNCVVYTNCQGTLQVGDLGGTTPYSEIEITAIEGSVVCRNCSALPKP